MPEYPEKTILPGCTKLEIYQLLLAAASSNLVGRNKNASYGSMRLFLSAERYRTEIKPNAGTTNETRVCCNVFK